MRRRTARAVLVTGGAGYIGSHTCKALSAAGFRPIVFDNLSRGHHQAVKWGPLVPGDLEWVSLPHDHGHLVSLIHDYRIVGVIHFAALSYVGESVTDPMTYYRNNVVGTLNLLDAMRTAGVDKIVLSSTCAVYGIPEGVPISETAPKVPLSPYGETKLAIERMLHWFSSAYGIRYAALRYFNAAGADPDGEIGEVHEPETHLIPLVIRAALGSGPPISIFGTDYPTPDGTAIRDYIHVTDLADAHVRALRSLISGNSGSIEVNLGTGSGYSVRQIIAAVERLTGRSVPSQEVERRPGDPPILIADSALANKCLGWLPQYSDIDTIIKTAIAWESGKGFGRASRVQESVAL